MASPIPPVPAGLLRRLGALLYDALLVLALWFLLTLLVAMLHGGGVEQNSAMNLVLRLLLILSAACFYAGFCTRGGQTLGMRAWRIKLVRNTGEPPTFWLLFLRFFLGVLSALPLGLGWIVAAFRADKLMWHDRWSNIRVVCLPRD